MSDYRDDRDDRRGGRDADIDPREVDRMCEDRQDARRARDFTKADRIREDLEAMGVELNDKRGEWTARSGQRGTYTINSGHGGEPRQTTRPVDEREVDRMCQERQDAKNDRRYREADAIRDELLDMGVALDDGRCEWECRGTRQYGRWERWGRGGRGRDRDDDRRGGRDYGRDRYDRDYDRRGGRDSRDRYDRR